MFGLFVLFGIENLQQVKRPTTDRGQARWQKFDKIPRCDT